MEKRPNDRTRKSITVIAGLLAAFFVLELGARLIIYVSHGRMPQIEQLSSSRYEPYLLFLHNQDVKKTYPAKDDEYRILILGGSTARQIQNKVVEKEFGMDSRRKIEAYNFSNGGWILNQDLVCLALYGINLKPDLVMSVQGINDIVSFTKRMPAGVPYENMFIEGSVERPFVNELNGIVRSSYLLTSLVKAKERLDEICAQKDEEGFNKMVRSLIVSIESAARISKGCGAGYVFVLEPYLHLRKNPTEKEKRLSKPYFYRKEFMKNAMRRLDRILSEQRFPENTYYISALDAFDHTDADCFRDEAHLTEKGDEIFVSYIAQKLKEKGFEISER